MSNAYWAPCVEIGNDKNHETEPAREADSFDPHVRLQCLQCPLHHVLGFEGFDPCPYRCGGHSLLVERAGD